MFNKGKVREIKYKYHKRMQTFYERINDPKKALHHAVKAEALFADALADIAAWKKIFEMKDNDKEKGWVD